LTSILGAGDVSNFPFVDFQMVFAPGSDVYLELNVDKSRDEFLHGPALPNRDAFLRYPIRLP
jgi:hypothetical protein